MYLAFMSALFMANKCVVLAFLVFVVIYLLIAIICILFWSFKCALFFLFTNISLNLVVACKCININQIAFVVGAAHR